MENTQIQSACTTQHVLYLWKAGGSRISNMSFPRDMVDMDYLADLSRTFGLVMCTWNIQLQSYMFVNTLVQTQLWYTLRKIHQCFMFPIVLRPSLPTPPEWLGRCRHCTLPPTDNTMYLHFMIWTNINIWTMAARGQRDDSTVLEKKGFQGLGLNACQDGLGR